MNNRSVALLLQRGENSPSCSCRSLCVAVLPIKTQFIHTESCHGDGVGRTYTENTCCFLFTILCTSNPFKLFPRLTGDNTSFHNHQVQLFNALSVSLLVKKQGLILFIIFDMGSVQYKCLFWPTDPDFLLCNVISGLGRTLRKRLGGDKKVLFSSAVKCKGGKSRNVEIIAWCRLGSWEAAAPDSVWAVLGLKTKVAFVGNTCWRIARGFSVLGGNDVVNP